MDQRTSLALWLGDGLSHLLQHPPESHHSHWRRRGYVPLKTGTNLYNMVHKPQNTTILRKQSVSVPAVSYLHWLFSSYVPFFYPPITCVKRWKPYSCSLHTFLQPVTSFPYILQSAFFPWDKKTNFHTFTKQQVTFLDMADGKANRTKLQCSKHSLNLTLRWLMSYIYGAPILDVSRSHTATQHSR